MTHEPGRARRRVERVLHAAEPGSDAEAVARIALAAVGDHDCWICGFALVNHGPLRDCEAVAAIETLSEERCATCDGSRVVSKLADGGGPHGWPRYENHPCPDCRTPADEILES